MDKIRILLADDHHILREGLRAVLETQPDFEVIAEAANGIEAVRQALTMQPDILLSTSKCRSWTASRLFVACASNSQIPASLSLRLLTMMNVSYTRCRLARTAT